MCDEREPAHTKHARKKWWVGRQAHHQELRVEVVDCAISMSISLLVGLSANVTGAHATCVVGVSGLVCGSRGTAAMQHEVRRRVDCTAVWPRCSDARCRAQGGAPRRWRRVLGGGADTIVHEEGGVTDLFRLGHVPFFWEPSSNQDTRTVSQDAGPSQAIRLRHVT